LIQDEAHAEQGLTKEQDRPQLRVTWTKGRKAETRGPTVNQLLHDVRMKEAGRESTEGDEKEI